MAFYHEFKNLTTGQDVTSADEFAAASVGTKFQRLEGQVYIKNADGQLDIAEAIPNLVIYDVNDTQIFP
jgi:hypothetical protein